MDANKKGCRVCKSKPEMLGWWKLWRMKARCDVEKKTSSRTPLCASDTPSTDELAVSGIEAVVELLASCEEAESIAGHLHLSLSRRQCRQHGLAPLQRTSAQMSASRSTEAINRGRNRGMSETKICSFIRLMHSNAGPLTVE
jgi:hypothetical protein